MLLKDAPRFAVQLGWFKRAYVAVATFADSKADLIDTIELSVEEDVGLRNVLVTTGTYTRQLYQYMQSGHEGSLLASPDMDYIHKLLWRRLQCKS